VEQHAAAVQDLHGHLRTAVLQARAGLERRAVQAHSELIGANDPEAAQRRQRQIQQESAATKSAAFTASLLRTKALLRNEIAQSSSALNTLTSSTRVLGSTQSELHTYGATVGVGRKIITKQLRRERTDKMLILLGLAFFALVVAYIVNRRLAPFLFWWTSFFVNKHAGNAAATHTPGQATQVHYTQPVPLPPAYANAPDTRSQAAAAAAAQQQPPSTWQPPSVMPAGVQMPSAVPPQPQQQPPPVHPLHQHASAQGAAGLYGMPSAAAGGGIPLQQQFAYQQQPAGVSPGAHQQHRPPPPPMPAAVNLHAFDEPPMYAGGHVHHAHDHAHEHGHAHGHAHTHAHG